METAIHTFGLRKYRQLVVKCEVLKGRVMLLVLLVLLVLDTAIAIKLPRSESSGYDEDTKTSQVDAGKKVGTRREDRSTADARSPTVTGRDGRTMRPMDEDEQRHRREDGTSATRMKSAEIIIIIIILIIIKLTNSLLTSITISSFPTNCR